MPGLVGTDGEIRTDKIKSLPVFLLLLLSWGGGFPPLL